jgi:hypothetical protein
MDIKMHSSCKPLKTVLNGFLGENQALARATNGFELAMGPASDPHFSTPPHAQDAIFVGDSGLISGYNATAEMEALFKQDPGKCAMRPRYNSTTRKWAYDVLKSGAMDSVNPLIGQAYSPWNVSFFQKVFKEPLLYSHARDLVSIEPGTNPWAELMTLALEQYAGFAIAAQSGSAQNNLVNDINVTSGLMTAPVINLSVSYSLSQEELERAKSNDNPFAGQAISRKQSYANYVIDMLTDYIVYYGNAETDTQGIFNINPIEAWPTDSLAEIAGGASTTKGADAYSAVFKAINSFLDASDNKFDKIKVAMSPQAYNLLTSLPYSQNYSPIAPKKIFEDNYMGGTGKDGRIPTIEFIADPMLKANSIFNTSAQDYLVITAPEIKAGPDEEVQALLPFGAPLMKYVFPAIPGQYNTQYKTLRRVAGVFAPVPIAAKVYSGFGV